MRTQIVIFGIESILHLLLLSSFTCSFENYNYFDDSQSLVFEYNRFPEVEKQCSPFLSLGSKVELTDSKIERIKNDLSFQNGDWEQENNGLAPLMLVDLTGLTSGINKAPLKLVNFEVKDAKSLDETGNAVGIGGLMSIGMTMSKSFSSDLRTKFSMNPGLSVLTIVFEGVYMEAEHNEGERFLCLLGNTTLPLHWQNGFRGPENWCPNLIQDDQILLSIRYPKLYSSARRAIQGEMRSLRKRRSSSFFDRVFISSQLGWYSDYQFSSSRELGSCNADVHQEELTEDGANNLSGSDFCRMFQELSNEFLNILPNYQKMNFSKTDIRKLGPFVLGNEVMFVDDSYKHVKLIVQSAKCKVRNSDDKTSSNAQVSAVFRVIPTPAPTDHFTESSRTGLSSMTLPAEGTWHSSTGQLCMVGSVPKGEKAQVLLYFPRVLSVKQRSIVFGSISSTPDSNNSFFALHFNIICSPFRLELRYGWYFESYLSYNYSKIKQADEFRRRNQSPDIVRAPKQSFVEYPAIQQEGGLFSLSQIYDLTYDLFIDTTFTTDISNGVGMSIKLEAVSIGPFLARYDFLYEVRHQGNLADAKTLFKDGVDGFLNVSLLLTFIYQEPPASTSISHKSLTFMFLEGLYDTSIGAMYLIGCGQVDSGLHVERGLDCLIEVKVQYPPITLRWVRDPRVQITITSQRKMDDPLYFSQIELQSTTIKSNKFKFDEHERDVAFQKIFEACLRVGFFAMVVAILRSQKLYMERSLRPTAYISLNMLACEILSYTITLITGGEILLSSNESFLYEKHAYSLHEYQPMLKYLCYAEKLLVLTTIFFNIRLFQKVSESRKSRNAQELSQPPLPLGDRHFVLWFLRKIAVTSVFLGGLALISLPAEDGKTLQLLLLNELTKFVRLLHGIFLIGQIAENWSWKNQGKSLRKVYYIGLPLLWLLLKIYDLVRVPISEPYMVREPADLNLTGFLFSDSEIMGLMVQVIILHIQQNYNYFWIFDSFNGRQLLNLRKLKQLLFKSRVQ